MRGLKPTVIVIPVGVDILIEDMKSDTINAAPGIARISNIIHWVVSNDSEPEKGCPKNILNPGKIF